MLPRAPAGRFTLAVSPTLFVLVFGLLDVLCQRQERRMDPRVVSPALATRLGAVFGTAVDVCAVLAGMMALWLPIRGFRYRRDGLACFFDGLTFFLWLTCVTMVV
ncbi:MAG TPA: hypothetical protein VFY93_16055 [Planctomycetota bacterium]|nr:hypothetical protein [Planctomycetota bacterium]